MEDSPVPPERVFGGTPESVEFRRTHYRVYDEDGFASSFAVGVPDHATLATVADRLCERFRGTGAPGTSRRTSSSCSARGSSPSSAAGRTGSRS